MICDNGSAWSGLFETEVPTDYSVAVAPTPHNPSRLNIWEVVAYPDQGLKVLPIMENVAPETANEILNAHEQAGTPINRYLTPRTAMSLVLDPS